MEISGHSHGHNDCASHNSLFDRFYTYKEPNLPVEVVVVQPNIDPYKEKFSSMPQSEQDKRILGLASSHITPETQLVVTPETSIRVVLGDYFSAPSMVLYKEFVQENPNTAFIFGATMVDFHPRAEKKPTVASRPYSGGWYEIFNSAIQLDTTDRVQVYHKSKLVVGSDECPIQTCSPSLKTWL